tara:strand:- start:1305 stop:2066 length:762 start_codon:yes stop_codon:yes gene_type:complete
MDTISTKNKILRIFVFALIFIVDYYTSPGSTVNYATMAIVAIVGGAVALTTAGIAAYGAHQDQKKEEQKAQDLENRIAEFEAARQPVINQSDKIRDLKSQVFNPYANLSVATQAADLQIQQTDQALANTLDTMRETGAGAGGATALARMAAQSKAGISASIEKQEVNNQKLAARGEADMMKQKLDIEQAAIREDTAAWGRQETRDLTTLDRLAGLQENAQAQAQAYQAQKWDAISGGAESAGDFAGLYGQYGM